jgi:hypothetical protein
MDAHSEAGSSPARPCGWQAPRRGAAHPGPRQVQAPYAFGKRIGRARWKGVKRETPSRPNANGAGPAAAGMSRGLRRPTLVGGAAIHRQAEPRPAAATICGLQHAVRCAAAPIAAGSVSVAGRTDRCAAASRRMSSMDGPFKVEIFSTSPPISSARSPRTRKSRSSRAERSAACGCRLPLT